MDFSFHESELAIRDLAKQVFQRVPNGPEHVREAWRELGRSQLLGVALPDQVGGSDSGVVALCLLVQQAGRVANLAPLIPSLVLAGFPLAQYRDARERLESLCNGNSILCGSFGSRAEPAVHARRAGKDYVLSGAEGCIEALPLADAIVLAAREERGGRLLFLLDPYARGVSIQGQQVASGCALGSLELSDVRLSASALLCEPQLAEALIDHTLDRAYLTQCAYELGLCETALELTARYAGQRQQFGRPIGTFQAVTQRIADMHVALETVRLTLWRAAWLAENQRQSSEARQAIAVARTIATQAGHQIVCAAQHIHGGMGFAREYPLHRYFLASKQNELQLGGHSHHLSRLGKLIAG